MWLINTVKLYLKDFHDESEIPAYAILSHTWCGDDEVSFQNIQSLNAADDGWQVVSPSLQQREFNYDGSFANNPGYQKISACCRQAHLDGFEWVWVDT
jgi:hypothetical protein